jgi:dipeptidyl-peptidase-4
MRYSLLLAVCGLVLVQPGARGQDSKPGKLAPLDTKFLRDLAETRGFMLGRPVKAQPTPDGKAVLFLRSRPRQGRLYLYEFDVATGKTRQLLTPEELLKGAEEKLSPEEKARRERMRVSSGGFAGFQLSPDGSLILVSLSGRLYTVQRAKGICQELQTGEGPLLDPKFSPDGKSVSYIRGQDIFVLDLATQKERAVTTGGTETITHGLAEFVAQEEMDRFTGYWWSPDSRHIAYEEADAGGVETWFVADPAHPGQRPHPSFYPRPGKANVKVRLGVVPVKGGDTVWVEWDRSHFPYLGAVHWQKGGPLLLTVQNREQTELALFRADPATGKTVQLLKEEDPAWINLRQEVPRWLADGSGFLWVSETGGGPRLEVRSPNGELVRVLVPAQAGYQGLVDLNLKGKQVVYNASNDPTQSKLFRVGLDGGKAEAIGGQIAGLYGAVFSRDHSVYVLTSRTKEAMPLTTVHKVDATLLGELPSVAEKPPFVPRVEYLKPGPEQKLAAAVIRPRNFDPDLKYPVFVDVYGGPHHKQVVSSQGRWLLDQWYADQGFIVVAIDGRGTPDRGRDWERAIKNKLGDVPLEDQIEGLKALGKRFPEMDLDRVGIDGWSFGGYLSALAVLRRPDVFKAGVAGAPVVDWLDYDTHYTERYLGVPPKDNGAYKQASLLTYAGELRRPLLLLHGTVDDNVYFRHSLRLVDGLFRAGKVVEILPLSGLTHMVPDPVVMERLHARIATFFRRHLGGPEPRIVPKANAPATKRSRPPRALFSYAEKNFWAFKPVKDSQPPPLKDPTWASSPIDRFILAKLETAGLKASPSTDRRGLIRRVTFDLIGLPPTPGEVNSFLKDDAPDAFARLVDRLLASPHYGERWARHWLDVVRYADTTANDANAVLRYAWRYRDYVASSFNQDKPYDQFLIEQLAGDLLPPIADQELMAQRVIATGFLMVGPKALAEPDIEQSRMDVVDDQIDTTGRALLGLTLGCARCHDHKYDPVPTADYYSLAGIFRGIEVFRDENRNAAMWQEWPLPGVAGQPPRMVLAPKEGQARDLHVFRRGNRFRPGPLAPRRFLQIIAGEGHAPLTTKKSGRLELANWIASKDNPLTARVMVNRLWQHHFGTGLVATSDNLGSRGEAPTHPELLDWLASRFVESGWSIKAMQRLMVLSSTYQMASRPDPRALQVDPNNRLLWRMPGRRLEAEELRDALLAVSGRLDRAIGGGESAEFLFREGEVIDKKRDFFRPNTVKPDHPYYQACPRRSLYLPVVRNALPDVLALFDPADPNGVTAARNDTTVPAQALFMLNNPFVREQALHFAQSLLADNRATDAERLRSAYARALGRLATPAEQKEAADYLHDYASRGRPGGNNHLAAWQSYCQMLFCANEFLCLD